MRKSMTFYLNDVNFWIALVYEGHQRHKLVIDWFNSLSPGQAQFCRITQLGLFRLLTNERVVGRDVLTQSGVWHVYDDLCRDPRVGFLKDAEADSLFRSLTQGNRPEKNRWVDAYLVSLAAANGMTVATLD